MGVSGARSTKPVGKLLDRLRNLLDTEDSGGPRSKYDSKAEGQITGEVMSGLESVPIDDVGKSKHGRRQAKQPVQVRCQSAMPKCQSSLPKCQFMCLAIPPSFLAVQCVCVCACACVCVCVYARACGDRK